MATVEELLLQCRCWHWGTEGLPPARQRARELLEKVLDAARTAAEMVEHHIAQDAPAQTRPPAQGGIDICRAHDSLRNQVIDLARKCGLQAVRDVTWHLLVEAHGPLPDRCI